MVSRVLGNAGLNLDNGSRTNPCWRLQVKTRNTTLSLNKINI